MQHVHDLIGIGFGPNNIALAVHLGERSMPMDCLYLESRPDPQWHPHMMLDTTDIQHAVLRDFISPVEPRSHFSFVNYLKLHGRMLDHLNAPRPFPLRSELADYVRWAARHFDDRVLYGTRVVAVDVDSIEGERVFAVRTDAGETHRARKLVLGAGRTPRIPPMFSDHLGSRVFHLNEYHHRLGELCARRDDIDVAVIGSSQSAAEIMLDLHRREHVACAHAVTRGLGFRLKDLSPFTERVFFPGFVAWFNQLDEKARSQLNSQLSTAIYSGVDTDALHDLYNAWHEDSLRGGKRLKMHFFSEVATVEREHNDVQLTLREAYTRKHSRIEVNAVILATGFLRLGPEADAQKVPPLLEHLSADIEREPSGCVRINPDYSVKVTTDDGHRLTLYVNGYAETSHGVGDAGSFPLMAHRADRIAWSLQHDALLNLRTG